MNINGVSLAEIHLAMHTVMPQALTFSQQHNTKEIETMEMSMDDQVN